jgi:predicted acyl esterase
MILAGAALSLSSCTGAAADGVSRTGYITIAGGVKLAYDLTLPAAHGRFPVALEYDDYTVGTDNGAEVAGSDAGRLLTAGFAVLGVNMPGSGCSSGVNDLADVNEWGPAGAQVVDWAAGQKWSTGHVGMFGSSQTGITQLGVASFRPRGLDAITPFHVATDYYRDVIYPGGVYNTKFTQFYAKHLVEIDAQTAQARIKNGDKTCAKNFREHVPLNRRYSIVRTSAANPFYDSYWQATPSERLSRIDVPILGCQSWQDGLVSSRAMELYYDTFSPKTTWFVGMNGAHGSCEFSYPLGLLVKFFEHYVAGVGNDWQQTPHITILHDVTGGVTSAPSPAWITSYDSWSKLLKPVTLYFRGDGSLAAAPVSRRSASQSSFTGPAPAQSGRWVKRPAPGTSVSYTTPPLTHDADFFGPASVNLWLSSTVTDTSIEVIISEVRPDGREQYVQAGWLNLADRALAPAGSGPLDSSAIRPYHPDTQADHRFLTPGQPVYARVEIIPFEHVFRAGSSIRITIDSAAGDVQPTGYWGLVTPGANYTDTIYAAPGRQSAVVLALIPGAIAKAPLPSCQDIAGEECRPNREPVPAGHLTIPGT